MATALVTGTSGYLGAQIADFLATQGWKLKRIAGRKDFAREVEKAFRAEDGEQPSLVVHAGFHVNFRYAPEIAFGENVENTRLVAQAAKRAGVTHFIFLSAAAVLGVSAGPLATRAENDIGTSDGPFDFWLGSQYVQEKLECERLLGECDLPLTVLYPTTTYGPGMQAGVRAGLASLRAFWKIILPVPPGGTSFLSLSDFLGALDQVIRDRVLGNFVVSSGNISYRELARAVCALAPKAGPRWVLPLPRFVFGLLCRILRARAPRNFDTVLPSTLGYKYYSPLRLVRASSWKPQSSLEDALAEVSL